MCKQCGKCCHRGDFWQYSKHPLIGHFANSGVTCYDTGMCRMLENNKCMIEKYLGKDAKPDICKKYDCVTNPNLETKND